MLYPHIIFYYLKIRHFKSKKEKESDLQTKRSPSVDDQDQNDDVEPIKKRKLMMLDSDEE